MSLKSRLEKLEQKTAPVCPGEPIRFIDVARGETLPDPLPPCRHCGRHHPERVSFIEVRRQLERPEGERDREP
jgi:hypothetical protein